jgi:hypothetical protein
MGVARLVGSDTIKINTRLITDLAHGEVAKLTYESDLVTIKTGKNGNCIYAKNETGNQATLELHVLRGSADDKFLNGELSSYNADPSRYVLMSAELTKVLGDGTGKVNQDTYILTGGVITKAVEASSNVEGDVEQAVSLYTMKFALAPRAIV